MTKIFDICIVVPCIYGDVNKECIEYWIKYHQKLGVNAFYMYCFDDNAEISNWIKDHPILHTPNNIIKYNGGSKYNCGQVEAIKRGYLLAKNHDFAIFMDTDEFIYISKMYNNLSDVLKMYKDIDHLSLGNVNYSYKKGIPREWTVNDKYPLERCWYRKQFPYSYQPRNESEMLGYCPGHRGKRKILINFMHRNKVNARHFIPINPHFLENTTNKNFPNIEQLRINEYRGVTIVPTHCIGVDNDEATFTVIDPFLNNDLKFE